MVENHPWRFTATQLCWGICCDDFSSHGVDGFTRGYAINRFMLSTRGNVSLGLFISRVFWRNVENFRDDESEVFIRKLFVYCEDYARYSSAF